MTNKLISLVIITLILSIGHSYSDDQFLFLKKTLNFQKIIKDQVKAFLTIYLKKNLINQKRKSKKEIVQEEKTILKKEKVSKEKRR